MINEEWRPVVGYEGWYEVSSQGRVRSVARTVMFADGRARQYDGKQLSTYLGNGYLRTTLKRNGKDFRAHVHTLVAEAFIGPRPEGQEVCHWDGDRANAELSNLRYGTRIENAADRIRHGTHVRLFARKIPPDVVKKIKAATGMTYASIAQEFGVSRTHAFNIRNNLRRKD